jgi:hypothetical protein
MQNKLFVYDELIDLLQNLHQQHPDKGYDRKALEIFERKQGRVFLEEMGQSGARNFAGIPEEIIQKEVDLDNQLEQTRKQLSDQRAKIITEQNKDLIKTLEEQENTLLSEQEALQNTIKTNYPDYYALRYPKPATLTELQQQVLQPGELLLVYGAMQDKTCLWVIGQEEFGLYVLDIGEESLAEKVAAFRRVLYADWRTRGLFVVPSEADQQQEPVEQKRVPFVQVSHELYTALLPEVVRSLLTSPPAPSTSSGQAPLLQGEGGKTLIIVPTGPLYALPFEALVTSPPDEIASQNNVIASDSEAISMTPRYLIEELPISYLSSASLLKTLREAQGRRKEEARYPLLAFAHPAYESPSPNPSHQGRGTGASSGLNSPPLVGEASSQDSPPLVGGAGAMSST